MESCCLHRIAPPARARIADLEAQLESIGAGGVSGPLMGRATDMSKEREALDAYLKDCDAHDIVPDVGGAWHAAFQAGRASLSANAGEPVAWLESEPSTKDWPVRDLFFGFTRFAYSSRLHMGEKPKGADQSQNRFTPLSAAPPTAQAEGWRPIETAPKDGTYLLLWEQYSTNPFVGCWAFGVWAVSHEHVDAEGGWDGANVVDSISQERITHWMPLPLPPTSAEGVEHGPQ